MAKLEIKYRAEGKAVPPRPIRVAIGDWGRLCERKKENGSEPEPWHCPAFVDACTHGFELLYQYETECHVLNTNGQVVFQWSRESEPGGIDPRVDFTLSNPPPPTEYCSQRLWTSRSRRATCCGSSPTRVFSAIRHKRLPPRSTARAK